jgi:hypothetical protein
MQNAAGLEHLVCLRQALVRHTSVAVLSVGNEAALCVRGHLSLPLSLCLARSLALSLARSFTLSLRLRIEEWLDWSFTAWSGASSRCSHVVLRLYALESSTKNRMDDDRVFIFHNLDMIQVI